MSTGRAGGPTKRLDKFEGFVLLHQTAFNLRCECPFIRCRKVHSIFSSVVLHKHTSCPSSSPPTFPSLIPSLLFLLYTLCGPLWVRFAV